MVADVDAVAAMFAAIEILLDASSRSPELQALAREYRDQSAREPSPGPVRDRAGGTARPAARERALLARLDLLPDGAEARRDRL